MTPLAHLLARIGWTAGELGRRLGISHQHAHRLVTGRNANGNRLEPPLGLVEWLERVAEAVETQPTKDL